MRRRNTTFSNISISRPASRTTNSLSVIGTDTFTGANASAIVAETRTAALARNTRQNNGNLWKRRNTVTMGCPAVTTRDSRESAGTWSRTPPIGRGSPGRRQASSARANRGTRTTRPRGGDPAGSVPAPPARRIARREGRLADVVHIVAGRLRRRPRRRPHARRARASSGRPVLAQVPAHRSLCGAAVRTWPNRRRASSLGRWSRGLIFAHGLTAAGEMPVAPHRLRGGSRLAQPGRSRRRPVRLPTGGGGCLWEAASAALDIACVALTGISPLIFTLRSPAAHGVETPSSRDAAPRR